MYIVYNTAVQLFKKYCISSAIYSFSTNIRYIFFRYNSLSFSSVDSFYVYTRVMYFAPLLHLRYLYLQLRSSLDKYVTQ